MKSINLTHVRSARIVPMNQEILRKEQVMFGIRTKWGAVWVAAVALGATPSAAGVKEWESLTLAGRRAYELGDFRGAERSFAAALREVEVLALKGEPLVSSLSNLG